MYRRHVPFSGRTESANTCRSTPPLRVSHLTATRRRANLNERSAETLPGVTCGRGAAMTDVERAQIEENRALIAYLTLADEAAERRAGQLSSAASAETQRPAQVLQLDAVARRGRLAS